MILFFLFVWFGIRSHPGQSLSEDPSMDLFIKSQFGGLRLIKHRLGAPEIPLLFSISPDRCCVSFSPVLSEILEECVFKASSISKF